MTFKKKKLLFIFGTRPEAIKMAPLILEAASFGLEPVICLSGQHEEMVLPFIDFFKIDLNYSLKTMRANQNLAELTSIILSETNKVIETERPDMVVVQGDTTTTFAGALSAFYNKIPVAHVEAGLRTYNKYSPFPEEINRQMISSFASLHFAPTEQSKQHLVNEKRSGEIIVSGNTSIDALRLAKDLINEDELRKKYHIVDFNKKLILVTTHRRENHGQPLKDLCKVLKTLVSEFSAEVILPVHLNPNVRNVISNELSNIKGVHLLPPLYYQDFVFFMKNCYMIITDSGGVQEEGPYFGKPILVIRENTERPEGVAAGTSLLVGTRFEKILDRSRELFLDNSKYSNFTKVANPYGNGFASDVILSKIKNFFDA